MPHSLQEFLASTTIQAASDLEAILLCLPEDKRNWKPAATTRSALDQVAECALMNERSIAMMDRQDFPETWAYLEYQEQIAALTQDWPSLQRLLHESAVRVAAVIRTVPDETALAQADTLSYPYWNMTYHIGQINYLTSLLGVND